MADVFYEYLNKSIGLLAIDDDPALLESYRCILQGHPLYAVTTAGSARSAESILQSGKPIHLCIMDLGINDINQDEFYLLKKYGHRVSFVVVSGAGDMKRAFEARGLGAADLISKPADMGHTSFWQIIGDTFLNRSILPSLDDATNPTIRQCCRILREKGPQSVSEWAALAGINDAYLRRLWTECFVVSPKHVLFLYRVYRNALAYCDDLFLEQLHEEYQRRAKSPDPHEHRLAMRYYRDNQQQFVRVLSCWRG